MAGRNLIALLVLAAGLLPAGAAKADPLGPAGQKPDVERLQPGLYPMAPASPGTPDEVPHIPVHLDWSIGLKGAYSSSDDGGSFLTTLNPAFTARHEGRRIDLGASGSAELARPWDENGQAGLAALRLDLSAETVLDGETRLSGRAGLDFSQPVSGMPGIDPAIAIPPPVWGGSAGLGLDRSFGKVNLALKGNIERRIYGETTRRDGSVTDNSDANLWQADAGLRAGFQVTPILEVFAEAIVGRHLFDNAAPALGVRTDATSTALRAGIAGNWNGILRASVSTGLGRHDFDAAGLGDIDTQLYEASLTYSPDPTVNLTASLSTAIEPAGADAMGTARVTHVAAAHIDYTVNSWLRLRASADWGLSQLQGSGEIERRHGLGMGADYAVSAHTALAADYAYQSRDNSSSGARDSHTVSLGITVKR